MGLTDPKALREALVFLGLTDRCAPEAEMKRTAFEAHQRELREAAELETTLENQRQDAELKHLAAMQSTVGLGSGDVLNLLVAREHGPPGKLIQIAGDCKPFVSVGDASDSADGSDQGGKGKGSVRRAPSPGRLFTR